MLVDSHCHIHDAQFYPEGREDVYARAVEAGVQMLLVGTSEADSRAAVEFAASHEGTWAVVGVHPHDTRDGWQGIGRILATGDRDATRRLQRESERSELTSERGAEGRAPHKIVGIGEIGLDYFYDNSPREVQRQALEQQLQWALDYALPVSFHVREASSLQERHSVWQDFWPILDNFPGVRGVLHSFTDTAVTLERALGRGLFIGVNGISTFTRDEAQCEMFAAIPLEKILLETDAPFLTPVPYRGRVNEPAFVQLVAEHLARTRGLSLETVATTTTANARELFAF